MAAHLGMPRFGGSEYLATIVPMSGLIGVHDLMWRNGSMEARGAIMHNGVRFFRS